MSLLYSATLTAGASLQALPSPAYSFGVGDFTVSAMVMTSTGGPLVSRKGQSDGEGNGGFLLTIDPSGAIRFVTYDGTGSYEASTAETSVLDGGCHTVIGVRRASSLGIFLDGLPMTVTTTGTRTPPLNVDCSAPLIIGATSISSEQSKQFLGGVMNIGLWSVALEGEAIVRGAFARVASTDPGLQGYWTLDRSNADISVNDNPAAMSGPVAFQPCLNCVWARGSSGYAFGRISNLPSAEEVDDAEVAGTMMMQRLAVSVPQGTPSMFASIMAAQDEPAYPEGVTVTITDPSGRSYDSDVNSESLFVASKAGHPWALAIVSPQAGSWSITVSAPVGAGFVIQMHTVPGSDVVETVELALRPLYEDVPTHVLDHEPYGGWLSVLAKVAVSAVVGVAVAAVVVLSGGAALPAVAAGVVAFTSTTIAQAELAIHALDRNNLKVSTDQVAGMAGFVVAADKMLLFDANCPGDDATLLIYKRREKKLYPYVTASSFNKVQQICVGSEDTRANVETALKGFSAGYVTASGHGRPSYLLGWFVSGNEGPMQEVLSRGHYHPSEARGKIFHIFGCWTGYQGSIGLGRDLVANGAVAFFGYSDQFILPEKEYPVFCDCDIAIDLALIDGKTCAEAWNAAIAKFNAGISRYEANGDYELAARLKTDRDRLVSPSVDAAYGDKNARLKTDGGR